MPANSSKIARSVVVGGRPDNHGAILCNHGSIGRDSDQVPEPANGFTNRGTSTGLQLLERARASKP